MWQDGFVRWEEGFFRWGGFFFPLGRGFFPLGPRPRNPKSPVWLGPANKTPKIIKIYENP